MAQHAVFDISRKALRAVMHFVNSDVEGVIRFHIQ